MKNLRMTLKAIAAAVLVSVCGMASAADSTTLNVSATVNTVCKFMSSTVPVAFGALDPDAGVQTVNTSVGYKCTNGASAPAVTFAAGTGSRTMTNAASDTLAYTITLGATAAGAGFAAAASNLSIQAQIAAAALEAAKAGAYSENVVLNINP